MRLEIDRLAPGMNSMNRWHWAKRKREKDAWTVLMLEALGPRRPSFEKCSVTITRYYARNPMDPDNLTSTAKVPLDALVRLGVIEDDNPDVVTLTVQQEKVPTMAERKTVIEIA